MKKSIAVVFLLLFFRTLWSQIPEPKESFLFPWAGGMNSVQFGEVDINRDGIKDLVVFDRQGNRLMPFINHGTPNSIDYTYEPDYISCFPTLFDWAIFVDYNNDGKSDIFTYSPGWAGMLVYKNISDDTLKFQLEVSPYLTSHYSGGEVNILVTYADYPAISDLDNDGDLDILTFWGLGSFVEMHKNLSMETYGHADSLIFQHTETCWGHFAESDESNLLYLDTCVGKKSEIPANDIKQDRHTGSTFLMIDLDADNDKDLLLADVDYPGMFALINGGDAENAYITEIDTLFPEESSRPVRLFSMPAGAYIDINNDNKKDLLVAPFDPSPFISKNLNNILVYLNTGENNAPHFNFYTNHFLQDNMIDVGSGAIPVLYDFDHDGLTDLFIGNYGYYRRSYYDEHYTLHTDYKSTIAYFKNTGSSETPVFQQTDFDFGGFYPEDTTFLGLSPTFGDIDNDGITEIIIGNNHGSLILMKAINGDFTKTYNYAGIDVGEYSVPQLFDLDNDGLLDLIIGKKDGKLSYYHNDGSAENPDFTYITDFLGQVDVTDYNLSWYGYSTPCFFKTANGETRLLVGSESGKVFLYKNIDNNLDGIFTEDNHWDNLIGIKDFDSNRGYRTAAAIGHLDSDDTLEMIVGNFSGGVEYFGGKPQVLSDIRSKKSVERKLKIYPNPAAYQVNIQNPFPGDPVTVSVFSMEGKEVVRKKFDHIATLTLQISELENGIYLVKLYHKNGKLTGKLVINRLRQ